MEHVITARPGETFQALEERLATKATSTPPPRYSPPIEDAPPVVVGPAAQDLGPGVYCSKYEEGRGDHDAEDGEDARGTEMLVIHRVAPKREDGDVHHYESQEEEHHGCAREGVERVGVAADRGEERKDHEGGEEDGDPGRTATRVDPGENLRQDILVTHAIDDPRSHDQVDERPVGDRD